MGRTLDLIIQDLRKNTFLADFKFRKTDSVFHSELDGVTKIIELAHWQVYPPTAVEIYPMYNVRFEILHRWFERFSARTLRDQRNDDSIGFNGKMLSAQNTFIIDSQSKFFEAELDNLRDNIKRNAEYVFSKYSSLQDLYEEIIVPILNGSKEMPNIGADWMFVDLALCKLVAPENYQKFKQLLVHHVDKLYKNSEPNILLVYDKMEEMFNFIESSNLKEETKKKRTAAKKIISRPKSLYKHSEKYKFVEDISKKFETRYGIKRSSWARWKCIDGYLFYFDYLLNPTDDIIFYSLYVKPIYVDDLLWEILGFKLPIKPFSLRITGGNRVSGVSLFNSKKWIIDGDIGYNEDNLSKLYDQIYSTIEQEINTFLKENTVSDKFFYFKPGSNDKMLSILTLCHHQKFEEALEITENELKRNHLSGNIYFMPDGTYKHTYDFIREYCHKKIKGDNTNP